VRSAPRLLLVAAALAPAGAGAAPQRLAVLPAVVDGAQGEATPRAVYDAVAAGVGLRLDLDLISYDELFLQGATSRATDAARCGSDQACVARILQEVDADLGLRAIVNFALEPPLVTVSVVERDGTRAGSPTLGEAGPAAPWAALLTDGTRTALDALGYSPAGVLVVRTDPPGAAVTVDGLAANPGGQWRLRPGRHVVRAEGPGGAVEAEAVVMAHRATELAVALPASAAPTDGGGGLFSSPWFWAGVGAVVLGAAAAAVVVADPFARDPTPGCLCVTTAGGPCGACP
jgi:hypothetical protein